MNHINNLSIVVPIMAGLGNAIIAIPMVRQLKQAMPDIRLTILARTNTVVEVYQRIDEVNKVILIGQKGRILTLWTPDCGQAPNRLSYEADQPAS